MHNMQTMYAQNMYYGKIRIGPTRISPLPWYALKCKKYEEIWRIGLPKMYAKLCSVHPPPCWFTTALLPQSSVIKCFHTVIIQDLSQRQPKGHLKRWRLSFEKAANLKIFFHLANPTLQGDQAGSAHAVTVRSPALSY